MTSQKTQYGFIKFLVLSGLGSLFLGCQSTTVSPNQYRQNDPDRPIVDEKYSLKADREKFEEMRADIPPEKKIHNDEMALFLQLLGEIKLPPSDVRSKFDRIARKKREQFNRDLTKEREGFTKTERKGREEFLRNIDSERKAFLASNPPREQRTELMRNLDQKRSDFFSTERDKRADFESDVRERRKNFEDYMREKTDQFNQEHRSYVKRFEEKKKQEADAKKEKAAQSGQQSKENPEAQSPEVKSFLEDFLQMEQKPSTPLESGQ